MGFKAPQNGQEQLFALSHPMDYYRMRQWNWFLLPTGAQSAIDWATAWCNKNSINEWSSSPATQKGLFGFQVFCFESPDDAQDAYDYLRRHLKNFEGKKGSVEVK